MLPSISGSYFCQHRKKHNTLTHTEREAKACAWGQARVFDSEVHPVSSSSVRNCVKHRKHNAGTVLQVVSEAQLATDFTVDVLFCSAEGGGWVFFSFSVAYIWKERCKWQLRVPL